MLIIRRIMNNPVNYDLREGNKLVPNGHGYKIVEGIHPVTPVDIYHANNTSLFRTKNA